MQAIIKPSKKTVWTLDEYHRMADNGFFRGQRVEFIEGAIIEMPPMKELHAAAVSLAYKAVSRVMGNTYWVRSQLPLKLPIASELKPDVSVVPGSERDYLTNGHPTLALLVIEASDSTLEYDQHEKLSLYARAGVLDYWIINLVDQRLEVYRDPVPNVATVFGTGYSDVQLLTVGKSIAPLASPSTPIQVADLIP